MAQGEGDQSGGGPDWVDTSLTSPTSRLFTPGSGALLALTSDGLMRSDDAGDDWYQVNTPGKAVFVDPTNQDIVYATTNTDPLMQSTDGGSTWVSLMSGPPYTGKTVDAIAISPADTNTMYVGLKQGSISDQYWFYGSQDGGTTWSQLFHAQYSLCGWGVPLLSPHPTDASRLFFSGGCHAGRDFSETLKQSVDYGKTFTDIYANRDPGFETLSGYPKSLEGGRGADTQRWYLAVNRDQRGGGSFLLQSLDDGGSWNPVLDYVGGGSGDPDKSNFSVTMSAIAYDRGNPDTVYVARSAAYFGYPPTPVSSGVSVSYDAGQSWNDLGNQQEGTLTDLKLGIDGKYLFLATDHGVARMSLQ